MFDKDYKEKYLAKGLLDGCGGELQHLISDAATMQIIRWTGGGFGMVRLPLPQHLGHCSSSQTRYQETEWTDCTQPRQDSWMHLKRLDSQRNICVLHISELWDAPSKIGMFRRRRSPSKTLFEDMQLRSTSHLVGGSIVCILL